MRFVAESHLWVLMYVVGLTKSGSSGKCRLAGEALQTVAFRCAMITVAVGTWVELSRSGGLTGGCGRTDVVGIDGGGLLIPRLRLSLW